MNKFNILIDRGAKVVFPIFKSDKMVYPTRPSSERYVSLLDKLYHVNKNLEDGMDKLDAMHYSLNSVIEFIIADENHRAKITARPLSMLLGLLAEIIDGAKPSMIFDRKSEDKQSKHKGNHKRFSTFEGTEGAIAAMLEILYSFNKNIHSSSKFIESVLKKLNIKTPKNHYITHKNIEYFREKINGSLASVRAKNMYDHSMAHYGSVSSLWDKIEEDGLKGYIRLFLQDIKFMGF